MGSNYKHGPRTSRKKTALSAPATSTANITVVLGTAPVNMCSDPYHAANIPIVAYSKADAIEKVGWSEDFSQYTICQSIYASFDVFAVAPIIMINVLDPKNEKHITAVVDDARSVVRKKALVDVEGILLDTIEITGAEGTGNLVKGIDYVASFADDGTVIIGFTDDGATKAGETIKIAYTKLNPKGVSYTDIIGGYNVSTREKKGAEVIGDVYPKCKLIPGTLIAPGFSHIPEVNTALTAKAELIYSLFSCKVVSDIDCSADGADSVDKVGEWKERNGYADRRTFAVWPMVKANEKQYYFSAQLAALLQRLTADNGGVPSESSDNKALKISGICLADGEEVNIDMDEANDYCNANGVITAINIEGFLAWGNNTTAYPQSNDILDRWITAVMMFDYIENNFKKNFFSSVGDKTNLRAIEEIVSTENLSLNGLRGGEHIAGGEISFNMDDNPITQILGGKIVFKERLATYPPMEDIENEFEFDPTILQEALEGGSNS